MPSTACGLPEFIEQLTIKEPRRQALREQMSMIRAVHNIKVEPNPPTGDVRSRKLGSRLIERIPVLSKKKKKKREWHTASHACGDWTQPGEALVVRDRDPVR